MTPPVARWFWARSIRARPVAFWALLGLSAGAVVAATLAPLVLAEIHTVSLAQETRPAVHARTAIEGVADVEKGRLAEPERGAAALIDVAGAGSIWLPAHIDVESQDPVKWSSPGTTSLRHASLSAPATECAGIRVTEGACQLGGDAVLVAESTARADGIKPGATVVLAPSGTTLRVAGTYDESNTVGRFVAAPGLAVGSHGAVPPPDLVVGSSTFGALGLNGDAYAVRQLPTPLDPSRISAVRMVLLGSRHQQLDSRSGKISARFETGIDTILQHDSETMGAADTLVEIIALEAVGAAWLGAALVSHRVGRERATEVALARTRGFSRGSVLKVAFTEPLVAVAAGIVPGVLLAVGMSWVIAPVLLDGTPPALPAGDDALLAVAAAALAVAGILGFVIAAGWRSAHLPLMQAFRESSESRELSRGAFAAQAVVLLVTVGLAATLVTQGPLSGAQTAVLTPTLIAVSIGVLALRLVVGVVRLSTRRTPRTPGGLIVARRLSRTPTMLWGPVLIAVGVALLIVSSDAASTVGRWQTERADAAIGASTVLHVTVPGTLDFEDAVRRADPRGRTAMAVAETTTGSGPARVVAVDSSRLAAVTTWSPGAGNDISALARSLAPRTDPSVVVRGTRLTVGIEGVRGRGSAGLVSTVEVDVVLAAANGWRTLLLGPPRDGLLSASMSCQAGCRVVSIGAFDSDPSPLPFSFHLDITSLSTDLQSAANHRGDLRGDLWRDRIGDSTSTALPTTARVDPSAAGLSIDFADAGGGDVASIAPRDAVEPLPVLTTPANDAVAFPGMADTFLGSGIDGSSRLIRVIGTAHILPRSGGTGVMADLTEIDRISDPAGSGVHDEVWLAPGSHPAVIRRLRADGIRITSTETADAARSAFLLEAPSIATRVDLPIALVGLLATVAALLCARAIAAPSRRVDLASLRAAGLGTPQLRGLLLLEFSLPPAFGVLAGLVGGVLASAATVSHLPLLVGDGAVPPSPGALDWPVIGAIVVAGLVVLTAVAVVQARTDLRDGGVQ